MDIGHLNLRFGINLSLPRCPHCGIARPHLLVRGNIEYIPGPDNSPGRMWATYRCTACGQLVLARGFYNQPANNGPVDSVYPDIRTAANELPEIARKFLQQAYETLHAPDAAAVMAGSAVDAMLKDKGLVEGTLYQRIDKAVNDHLLTKEMGDWAHWVRLGSNRPRHADKDTPHVSQAEAMQSVEFAESLGQFLYVLSSRISKGIKDAQKTAPGT